MQKIISEVKEISVCLTDSTRITEKGFEEACRLSRNLFGIDEYWDGSRKIKDWDGNSCSVKVQLKEIVQVIDMGGVIYHVIFKVWCEKYVEGEG